MMLVKSEAGRELVSTSSRPLIHMTANMRQVDYVRFRKKGHFLHARMDYLNISVSLQIRLSLLNHIRVSVNRVNLSLWQLVAENFGQLAYQTQNLHR
jgi:hypothetical protein